LKLDGNRASGKSVKEAACVDGSLWSAATCRRFGQGETHSLSRSSYGILSAFAEHDIAGKRGLNHQVTLIEIQDRLKQQVRAAALDLFGVELEQIGAEVPPRPELGDLAFPVSFELAKLIKQATGVKTAPRSIAEQMKAKLESSAEVARVEVAGAGYLNVFFERAQLLAQFAADKPALLEASLDRPKKMVEHTSINPNKAAHIGHIRNAVLGDTFVRILQATRCSATRLCESCKRPASASRCRTTSTTPAFRWQTWSSASCTSRR
jgi:hypothetical protein